MRIVNDFGLLNFSVLVEQLFEVCSGSLVAETGNEKVVSRVGIVVFRRRRWAV
jgi:hypothetical protein